MALIADDLRGLVVPIESVQLHPSNPRQGDVGALSESLKRFGQLRPIVVQRSTGYVVAGNHLLRAARALAWTHIAAHVLDLDDVEAAAYLVADNRLAELAWYDNKVLTSLLTEQAQSRNLTGTGYDGEDVDDVVLSVKGVPRPAMQTVNVSDTIVWDDAVQLQRWRAFGRWLKTRYEDLDTFPQRLDALVREALDG
ncbi:MAG: hypothetical protein C0498_01495 [Anaerolinea sp.]|nr:hypothetical protein [Anaerolinea sp.]